MKKILKICTLLLVLSAFMSMTAIAETIEFADVNEADYFYPAVQWGVKAGITQGVGDKLFSPDGEVTRAQAVTFLWNMAGNPTPTAIETFSDVDAGSWYETAVAWAVENDITAGTGEGMFSPDVICNRAMCITLLYRLMDAPMDGIDFSAPSGLDEDASTEDMTIEDFGNAIMIEMAKSFHENNIISDVEEGAYYDLPVIWACLNGIITADNTAVSEKEILFRPTDPCVRKEMISFLYQTKIIEDFKNAPAEVYFDQNTVPIPQEYFDRLYFYYYGGGDEEIDEELLLIVSEKASIEAAEAMGEEETEGIGELFRIVRVSESRLHELLCGDMSGIQTFAEDEEGRYYLFCTPTDVRYVREDSEKMDEDIDLWTELNEWARGELCNEILDKNSNLTAVNFTNTELDMYLARIAFDKYTDYTISTTEFGELKPKKADAKPYAEQLLNGTFVELEDMEAPDGEYVVLNFPKDNVRFDFFTANKNLVRKVRGDNESFYKRGLEGGVNNTETMQEWYDALAKKAGKK